MCEFACASIGAVPAWLSVHICEACHFETCESETCCVCVTRRLVATGGGKQADLYSFDQPGGRGRAGGVSKKVRRRTEMHGKWSLFQCAAGYVNMYAHKYLC